MDALDSAGKDPSYITSKPWTQQYLELAKRWSQLPLYQNRDKVTTFFKLLQEKQVILLVSGTGSGKTVLVPKFVLKYMIENGRQGMVATTNPKTLTTVYNAEYAAKTLDVELGQEVGYKFKGSPASAISETKTRLLYCTDGTLLARTLGSDPLLKGFDAVIVDEAHERQVQIDLLLHALRRVVQARPDDFKLIIMSATINPEVFRTYFDDSNSDTRFGEITISGQPNLPITQRFLKSPIKRSDYVEKAVRVILKIMDDDDPNNRGGGDIIAFVATENDAIKGCALLASLCMESKRRQRPIKHHCDGVLCIEVFSRMKASQKELAMGPPQNNHGYHRKVLFATNVAESSLTVDGLVYVVDSGYELRKYYDPVQDMDVVTKGLTSQAQVRQRIGRVGRTQPGKAYHLYTKKDFQRMREYPDPSIKVTDLSKYILAFLHKHKTLDMLSELITPPSPDQVDHALRRLASVGAIYYPSSPSSATPKVTRLGSMMLRLSSVEILDAYALLLAVARGCDHHLLPLLMLIRQCDGNTMKLFYNNNNSSSQNKRWVRQSRAFLEKHGCIHPTSEHLSLLYTYEKLYKGNNHHRLLDIKIWDQAEKECAAISLRLARLKAKGPKRVQKALAREGLITNEAIVDSTDDTKGSDEDVLHCLAAAYGTCNRLLRNKKDVFHSPSRKNMKVQLEYSELLRPVRHNNNSGNEVVSSVVVSSFGRVKALCISLL